MTTPPDNDHPLYQKPRHPVDEGQEPQQAQRQKIKRPVEDRPYLTYGLIVINLLIFLAGFVSDAVQLQLFVGGALFPPLVVEEGQVYRLFTAMFLHGDAAHIFFNMYALYIVGVSLEPIFGRLRFGIVYFLGGLGGSVLSLLLGTYSVPSVGASGAVFAIFTAYAVHLYQHRTIYRNVRGQLQQMIFMLGINLVLGFIPGSRIDNWGHIGGLIGGGILAWRISPQIQAPTAPIRSLHDLAKTDTNPLVRHLPYLVVYVFGLIGLTMIALNVLGP
jgi:rhomboid protease GluP